MPIAPVISEFRDVAAERVMMAGLVQYGSDVFIDVDGLVRPEMISDDVWREMYVAIGHYFAEGVNRKLDYHSLIAVGKKLGLGFVSNPETKERWRALANYPIQRETAGRESAKIFRLSVMKELDAEVASIRRTIHQNADKDPTLAEILGMAENPIFDFTSRINTGEEGPVHIAKGGREWLEAVASQPRDNIGIPSPFARYNTMIGGGFRRKTVSFFAARRGHGKMQPLDSPVATPSGWVLMGDIRPGDRVLAPDGGVSNVLSVHPQGDQDIYRVVFADGDSTECGLDHLWEVRRAPSKVYQVVSLREMLRQGLMRWKTEARWRVKLPSVVNHAPQDTEMDPYLLGLLLGNGGMTTSALTWSSSDTETDERLTDLLPPGHRLNAIPDDRGDYYFRIVSDSHFNTVRGWLRDMELLGLGSHDKFIPDRYKYNTPEVRWGVLQGLCDTDGSANVTGDAVDYATASRRLAYDIKEVVQSLGGLCRVTERWTRCQTGEFHSYRLSIKHDDPTQFFRLSRKQSLMHPRRRPPITRSIKSVEYVGCKPAQCIKIDTPDGLYLTDRYIVTHNTILCDNICLHVAKMQIPVLNIDTEMTIEEHRARIIAHMTGIDSNRIERGNLDPREMDACRVAMEELEGIPYHYHCIQSESFDEQLASLRRWAIKKVGVDAGGRRKDCLVVYDWLQMEDPRTSGYGNNYQEYQTLFFQTGALKAMADRCDLPIVAMGQLNREGGIAGSDRITFKVASFTLMHRKDKGELMDDPEYQLKFFIDKARHGPGSMPGDYINLKFDGATARMEEGPTRYEMEKQRRRRKGEFEVEGGDVGELDFAEPEGIDRDEVPRQRRAKRTVRARRGADR